MWKDFKAFINQGGVFQVAVGLIMALAFKPIVDSVVDLITNLISRILSLPDFSGLEIKLGGSKDPEPVLRYGALINNVISFLVIALVLFMLVKAYNRMMHIKPDEPGPTEIELLTDIRDSLARR